MMKRKMLILFRDLVKHSKNSIIHTPPQLHRRHEVQRRVHTYTCKLGVCTYTIWVVTEPSTLLFWKVVVPPTARHSHNSLILHPSHRRKTRGRICLQPQTNDPGTDLPQGGPARQWVLNVVRWLYHTCQHFSSYATLGTAKASAVFCFVLFFKHSLSKNSILATNFVKLKSVGSISTINWEKSLLKAYRMLVAIDSVNIRIKKYSPFHLRQACREKITIHGKLLKLMHEAGAERRSSSA